MTITLQLLNTGNCAADRVRVFRQLPDGAWVQDAVVDRGQMEQLSLSGVYRFEGEHEGDYVGIPQVLVTDEPARVRRA